jgi:hypothetical protein
MRHGLAGCFTPGTGLWAGRLHSDWSCDRHRVPRPSQIDPVLPFAAPPKTLLRWQTSSWRETFAYCTLKRRPAFPRLVPVTLR